MIDSWTLGAVFVILFIPMLIVGVMRREGLLILFAVLLTLWAALCATFDRSFDDFAFHMVTYAISLAAFVSLSQQIERHRLKAKERAERMEWRGLKNV